VRHVVETVWPYLAVMLLAAGLFPALESRFGWRVFSVLPPIVWTYLLVMALAATGLWAATAEVQAAQRAVMGQLLPALLFLFMVTCDLRAIVAVGPRVLAVFACTMASILAGITLAYLAMRALLPAEGWKMMAALAATWTGGSANLVAVAHVIDLPESSLPSVLLADSICYSTWVLVLFSTGRLATAFDRWTRAKEGAYPELAAVTGDAATTPGDVLLWLGGALAVGLGSAWLAAGFPTATMFTPTSWTVLIATVAGLLVARTPLARIPGSAALARALLAVLVAVLASQSSFRGLASAPVFVLAGFLALALHVALLAGIARLFRFRMHLCGIASLAQIGGVATAPLLAATYAPVLVPIAVLLAMLGLILGTGVGLGMAALLAPLAPAGG
jgi:uncharacterized membrane protein